MANHNKTLHLIAAKLGLSEEEKVLSKAAELERLLQIKWTTGRNITDTGKVVICLDLAAGMFGADLDLKTAIKYSGLKPAMYTNNRKVVENLLDLNSDKLTSTMLCVTLQCSGVQELADNILEEYRKLAKMEVDLNLPQYVCMAVYHACRIKKIKVSKSKLIEKSRLKPAQWAKLDGEWTKFVEEHFPVAMKKKGRPPKVVTGAETTEPMEIDQPKDSAPPEPQIEPYEVWKRRILEEAYKERELLEEESKRNTQRMTPRRSPRKTPIKHSPYKSSSKVQGKGVRLLFPIGL